MTPMIDMTFQLIAFFDDQMAVLKLSAEVVLHHGEGLVGGDDARLVVDLHEIGDIGGVVWFHVLNDQIVGLSSVQYVLDIVEPLVGEVLVDRIHDGDLVVEDHIGVVGHSVGDFILSFEQIDFMVVDAYIFDCVGDFHK